MKRRGRLISGAIALAFCGGLVALWFHAGDVYDQQVKELQTSLGTADEPLTFMAAAIKPGVTRDEVRQYVRGYAWLETHPPGPTAPGGADLFRYQFGLPRRPVRWAGVYGTIVVIYDAEGRVLGELDASGRVIGAVADLN